LILARKGAPPLRLSSTNYLRTSPKIN
jgi:hypothetical protein